MAHNTTNRRILATSSDQPNTSMDPTHKRHHHHHHPSSKPTTTTAATAASIYRTTNPGEPTKNFSSSSTNQRVIRTTTTHFDTHLQAKAMSLSAMADSSKPNRDHPHHHHHHHYIKTVPNLQNQKKPTQEKSSSRRALKGPNSQQREVVITEEGHEEIKRLSSGAIVKIKELKVSDEDHHHHHHHHHHDNDGDADEKKSTSIVSSIGKRRSFSGSKIELSDFLNSSGARVVSVDMPPFMQIHAVGCARKACDSLEKFTSKALALSLKKEFDGVYGPAWHCIVGSSFGSFVTHSVGGFLYFSMDHKLYVLLFKTSVHRAD